tara:strand:+ start:3770 stop:4408 length:639 start_codon:yes stop_codon:yes gene_type:complete
MKILILIIFSYSAFGQLMSLTFTPRFSSGRAMHGGINLPRPIQVNPQRMIPFRATPNQQAQPQQSTPTKQPLRAINNRYPKNNSNIMGFRSYERINLKDHKKRAEAAKIYKEKLSTLRISLRSYRKSPPTPTTPPALPPTIATNSPPPVGGVTPAVMPPANSNARPAVMPNDTPRTPTIQPRPWLDIPNDIPTNSPPAIAIGMPAPQPRQLD